MNRPQDDPSAIVAEAAWLRRLAQRLVEEPADAEDLAQATAAAAVEHRPDSERSLRGWLATVARRFRWQADRARRRRELRELQAAASERVPSASELVERLETQQRVLAAVRALDEPDRSTILLRYFEGLEPAEIARRTGVPAATVRVRAHRALLKLRARLESESSSDGRSWLLAMLPLCPKPTVVSITGVVLMNAKLILGAAAVLAVGGASLVFFTGETSAPPRVDAGGRSTERTAPESPAALVGGGAHTQRESVADAPAPGNSATRAVDPQAVAAAAREPVRGLVLDCDARPAAGVVVDADVGRAANAPKIEATSGADGRFEMSLEDDGRGARITASSPDLATVFSGRAGSHGLRDTVVVVAPAIDLAGLVVDEDGAAVPDPHVEVDFPNDLHARFGAILDASEPEAFDARGDAAGAFAMSRVAMIAKSVLIVRATGFDASVLPVPPDSDRNLRVVLRRTGAGAGTIAGQVVDPIGAPVAGAFVSLRGKTTRTGANGKFTLAIGSAADVSLAKPQLDASTRESPASEARLVAVKSGYLPATFEAALGADGPQFPAFVVLQLGAKPLSISGIVVDADGVPKHGAAVWIADPTFFGFDDSRGPVLVENLLIDSHETWRRVDTDEHGRFALPGLAERAYTVIALDTATMARAVASGVRAGATDVTLRIASRDLYPVVRGRVVASDGKGVEGAQVRATLDAFKRPGGTWMNSGAEATTGADGAFELHGVPEHDVYLRVDGDGLVPAEFGHGAAHLADVTGQVEGIVIHVTREIHLRVELLAAERADRFAVLDASGTPIDVSIVSADGRVTNRQQSIADGKSSVVTVAETATTIVLYRDKVEVGRLVVPPVVDGIAVARG